MGFFSRGLTPEEAGLDLDKLQDALERIAAALESIDSKLKVKR